jgi:hypothetical protein
MHRDPFHPEAETGVIPIVIPCAKVGSLRDADIRSNLNMAKIIDPDILSYPGIVADTEVPRVLHSDTRLDDYPFPDLRSEKPKK